MNILIVDDQPNIVRVTVIALKQLGCQVFTAATLDAAAGVLRGQKIDAVFLDLNLGNKSGLDFLSQLLLQPAAPAVVLFTAMEKEEAQAEALRCGAFGCLTKPFTLDDLRQQIMQIEHYHQQRQRQAGCL